MGGGELNQKIDWKFNKTLIHQGWVMICVSHDLGTITFISEKGYQAQYKNYVSKFTTKWFSQKGD